MNKVLLSGNVVKDSELMKTANEGSRCTFTLLIVHDILYTNRTQFCYFILLSKLIKSTIEI
jgi:single-stranded DNA-binding protein